MFITKYLLLSLFIYGTNIVETTDGSAIDNPTPCKFDDSKSKTGVELSLKATAETNEFNYNKSGQVVTFTAKDNYGFNIVKQDKTEIWKTDKETEYASKVVLNGKGKGAKTVTIHMPDGSTKSYKKDGKNKPWSEVTQESSQTTGQPASGTNSSGTTDQTSGRDRSGGTGTGGSPETGGGGTGTGGGSTHTSGGGSTNESGQGGGGGTPANQANDSEQTKTPENTAQELQPSDYPQDIKVFKADPNDATKTKELDTNEYKVKKDGDNDYIYEFNNGVNCTLVKREEKDVWKYDSSKSNAKYPKSMTVMKETVFIDFDGSKEVYSKAGNEWYLNKPVTNKLNNGKTGGQ